MTSLQQCTLSADQVDALRSEIGRDGLEYILRMFWLGRGDKIPSGLVPGLVWATEGWTDIGKGCSEAGFHSGRVLFRGHDHLVLSQSVADSVERLLTGTAG